MSRTVPPPLLIAGMHRSGTSLTASWLHACGLHLGNALLGATIGNEPGLFEDDEAVGLHRALLADAGLSSGGLRGRGLRRLPEALGRRSDPERIAAARALIERRGERQWGFKDPRSALFLDLWRQACPSLVMLGVYRPAAAVVDSIRRRGARPRPDESSARAALRRWRYRPGSSWARRTSLHAWCLYNERLVEHARRRPARSLLLALEDVLARGPELIRHLNATHGFTLEPVPTQAVFRAELLTRDAEVVVSRGRDAARVAAIEHALSAARADSMARLTAAEVPPSMDARR